jgi:hypothetical protein
LPFIKIVAKIPSKLCHPTLWKMKNLKKLSIASLYEGISDKTGSSCVTVEQIQSLSTLKSLNIDMVPCMTSVDNL